MKNILIPFDFSEVAENALVYTISLFENIEVTFHLLYVYESSPSELLSDEYNDNWFGQIDDSVEVELKQYVRKLNKNKSEKHKFLDIVHSDTLAYSIQYVLKVEPIDLIISGTKGATDRSDIFITTKTLGIIKRIQECPIIVVPFDYDFIAVKKVILSTNFKQVISPRQLQHILNICILHGACLEVVNLTEQHFLGLNQKENKKSLEVFLSSFYHCFKKIDWLDSESKTLMNYMKSSEGQLLCLINHKNNFFIRFLEENIIKKVNFYSSVPLMILQ